VISADERKTCSEWYYTLRMTSSKPFELLGVALLPFIVLALLLKPWAWPLTTPYIYHQDALFSLYQIRNLQDTGLPWQSLQTGLTTPISLLDFPNADGLNWLLLWGLASLTSSTFLIANVFWWLTFSLSAVSAYWVWRQWSVPRGLSLVGSMLFAFLPYHLVRATEHLLLSNYAVLPLVVWLLVGWLKGQQPITKSALATTALIGLLASGSGLYYAWFSLALCGAVIVVLVGKTLTVSFKEWQNLILPCLFGAVVVCGVTLQLIPNLRYQQQMGANTQVGQRGSWEADNNSLKFWRFFLPLSDYGVPALEQALTHPTTTTETKQYIGIVAALGVLLGIAVATGVWRPSTDPMNTAWPIAQLLLMTILIGHDSGLGTLGAYAISPQIRAYGRLLPVVGFLALSLSLLAAQELFKQNHSKVKRRALLLAGVSVFFISLFDQVAWFAPSHSERVTFEQNQVFFGNFEATNPEARVFVLPYKPFPESPPIHEVGDYELLLGPLHTNHIYWSYPVMKGRDDDLLYQKLAALPLSEFIPQIKKLHYTHLYINWKGYCEEQRVEMEGYLDPSVSDQTSHQLLFALP
jgi:phosphoglycerol transferase